jgi:mRNA interferase RelE/StbE
VTYQVLVAPPADRRLARLDRQTQLRIRDRLRELTQNPFDARISKWLKDLPGKRSSRVGGWRIIYSVDQERSLVHVQVVERRGQVYDRL